MASTPASRVSSRCGDEMTTVDREQVPDGSGEVLRHVPVDLIDPCPGQPRRRMAPRAMEELIASVREHGVLQPIRVRPRGERYEIITGERRWTAARWLGLREIPAVVADIDDEQAGIQALVENIHREDLTVIERAHALARVRRSLGLSSWEAVGDRLGLTKGHVRRLLNVTRLAEEIRDDVRIGDLSEKHVRALYGLRSLPRQQLELWDLIHTRGLSGDDSIKRSHAMRRAAADGMTPHQGTGEEAGADPRDGDAAAATADRADAVSAAMEALTAAVAALTPHELTILHDRLACHCERIRGVLEGMPVS